MNITGLFNGNINQDSILNNGFEGLKQYDDYSRYVTINFGLGGFFTKRSAKEMLEGYTDNSLLKVKQTPVYLGGDLTVDPFLSLNSRTP